MLYFATETKVTNRPEAAVAIESRYSILNDRFKGAGVPTFGGPGNLPPVWTSSAILRYFSPAPI